MSNDATVRKAIPRKHRFWKAKFRLAAQWKQQVNRPGTTTDGRGRVVTDPTFGK